MPEPIAHAYLRGGRTQAIPGLFGGHIAFRGGAAPIHDERQIPLLLQRADITLTPTARYQDFVGRWLGQLRDWERPQATIAYLDGRILHPPAYEETPDAPHEEDGPHDEWAPPEDEELRPQAPQRAGRVR